MKTETRIKKDFDTVAFFRNVKEQIANELQGKSFDEQKEVLKKIQSGEIALKPLNEAERSTNG
jgi:poly-gamma-glutamate capsule biosynthesis protein CapA/YwtB (metallophosphatase superfamily)